MRPELAAAWWIHPSEVLGNPGEGDPSEVSNNVIRRHRESGSPTSRDLGGALAGRVSQAEPRRATVGRPDTLARRLGGCTL